MVHVVVPEWNDKNRNIVNALRKFKSKSLKICIPKDALKSDESLKCAMDMRPIEGLGTPDFSLSLYEWNIEECSAQYTLDEYRYLKFLPQGEKCYIVTQSSHPKNVLSLFYDKVDDIDLPDEWYKYHCYDNEDDIVAKCEACGAIVFALREGIRFDKAFDPLPHTRGAAVFRERSTGYLWYKDTLHKDHCEVFDPEGKKHLGIAKMSDGKLDTSKADTTKKPIL